MADVQREVLGDGSVRIWDDKCSFHYFRPRPGVVLIMLAGRDNGQFGTATIDELRQDISRYAPVEVFFDMQDTVGANLEVQETWTEWIQVYRSALKSVNFLVRSNYMHVTIEIAKFFSRTGELIRVYLDPAPFEQAIARAAPSFTKLPPR
jgi:hypothetical protein